MTPGELHQLLIRIAGSKATLEEQYAAIEKAERRRYITGEEAQELYDFSRQEFRLRVGLPPI